MSDQSTKGVTLWGHLPDDVGNWWMRHEIERFGFGIMIFEPGPPYKAFGITVGLTESDHPEFAVVGDDGDAVHALLDYLAQQVIGDDAVFTEGINSTALFPQLDMIEHVRAREVVKLFGECLQKEPTVLLVNTMATERMTQDIQATADRTSAVFQLLRKLGEAA